MLRVRNWDEHYEKAQTRAVQDAKWVPMPVNLAGAGYIELVADHPSGPAHFAVWCAILQVAAKCTPRGDLVRSSGRPHDAKTLSRMIHIDRAIVQEALSRLIELRWLDEVDDDDCNRWGGNDCNGTATPLQSSTPRPLELQDRTGQDITTDVGAEVGCASSPPASDSALSLDPNRFPRWCAEIPTPGGPRAKEAQVRFAAEWPIALAALEKAFPEVDVLAEAAKFYAYEETHPKERKGPGGRLPALHRWVQRSVNRGNAVSRQATRSPPADPRLPAGAVPIDPKAAVNVRSSGPESRDGWEKVRVGEHGGYAIRERQQLWSWDDEEHISATCVWNPEKGDGATTPQVAERQRAG